MRTRLIHAGLAMTLAGALAGCGGREEPAPPSGRNLGHVHGLDIDPADGSIYVAAHQGLFKITGRARAELVGGKVRDTMGFTIIEPRTFLASGHPAPQDMKPGTGPHLGLISSTDTGTTWTTVSEGGNADFHALQQAGEVLYGYDSQTGRLRASTDGGARWKPRARLDVLDLAASSADPARLLATTPNGPQVSMDGGRTFRRMAGAPPLTHLDVAGAGILIGIDTNGTIRTSSDAGTTWRSAGGPGGPASAFTAVDPTRLLVATKDGTIRSSRDGGRTFDVVYRPAEAGP